VIFFFASRPQVLRIYVSETFRWSPALAIALFYAMEPELARRWSALFGALITPDRATAFAVSAGSG